VIWSIPALGSLWQVIFLLAVGSLPVATGIALAEKKKGTGAVSTVFLGDGTLGEGVTYESLNVASLWQLPVIFVVRVGARVDAIQNHIRRTLYVLEETIMASVLDY